MTAKFILIATLLLAQGVSAQTNGLDLYNDSYLHRIDVTFQQTGFWDSLSANYENAFNTGEEVPYMRAAVSIDGTAIDSIGIKQKGYYSNWGAGGSLKKPLKISLSTYLPDQKYDGIKKINLSNGFKDPAMMRDALAYKFMRDAGIKAPRTAYAKVYLNGTYWGLYLMVEEVDKRSLKNWYPDNNGNLYKCVDNTSLQWYGNNSSSYLMEFELQTNEADNNWSGFLDFVDKVNNSGSDFKDSILTSLNMDKYLDVLAADILMLNWDSYYNHGRNFFLYENPANGLVEWIPWDYNLAFSTTETGLIVDYQNSEPKPLVQHIQEDPILRSAYLDHVCILNDNYFTIANLGAYIDAQGALIRTALAADSNKFYSIAEFDNSLINNIETVDEMGHPESFRGLKQFITERRAGVTTELSDFGHHCATLGVDEQEQLATAVFPNPFTQEVTVRATQLIERIEIFTSYGQLLTTLAPQSDEVTVFLGSYANGAYLLRIYQADAVSTKTIYKAE
jgi:hypothetical protein